MGYEIVLCKVESVDTVTKKVFLKPHTPSHFSTIEVTAGDGLKFASSYAPYTRVADPDKGKVFNTPVGFVNYPQQNDLVLAAIWITDVSRQDRLRTKLVQNQNMEVIIFAKISWDFPDIGTHDNILGDRSGAKVHFNHGWLDINHFGKDAQGDKTIHLPTGHLTTVANRMVRIAGQKFLPFGLHSHKLGLTGVMPTGGTPAEKMTFARKNSKIINEEDGETVGWGEAFTQDPTEANLYNDLISLSKRGSKKFLEPPCPEPGSMMDMHDSGYKLLVGVDGHVREYVPKGRLIIIGQDGNQTEKKMSFDPEGQSEDGTYPDAAEGVLEIHLVQGAKTLVLKFDPTNDLVELTTSSGKFKVTGNIEATLDVKGATGTFG